MLAGLVWCCCLANFSAHAAEQDVTVAASRRVHPVLIRNDHNPLLQVVVEVRGEKEVRLRAVRFTLDRCDDVADLAHRVAAVCTTIETTAAKVEAKDVSPTARQRIGIALRKHNADGVHTYRIPALATTPKGTLLCVYDMRRRLGRDLQEDIDIGLSRSTNGGHTWEPVRVIMDMGKYGGLPEEQNGCSDPGILVDRTTGDVFCFAVWMHGKPGKHQWTGDGSEPGYEIGKSAQLKCTRS
jgi:sialidase-1